MASVVRLLLPRGGMGRVARMLALVALVGCDAYTGSTEGERGLISFYEPNSYPDDEALSAQGFELAIALGARVDVWTTSPGVSSFAGADIDDPSVLSIESAVYPIVLRARGVGTATLRVEQTDGDSDTLPMTVVSPDDARVWIDEAAPLLGPSDASLGTGYALRRGASIRVAGQPRAAGRPLLGFDVLEWSIDETLFSHSEHGSVVNTRIVEGLGVSGVATITTQYGGAVELAGVADDAPMTLTLRALSEDLSTLREIDAIGPQDLSYLLLSANDAEGRLVRASLRDRNELTATVTEGTVTVLEASIGAHALELRACAGSGTLELSYVGARLSVPIEVTPDVADPACP